MRKLFNFSVCGLMLFAILSGCGGGGTSGPATLVSITVSPAKPVVGTGTTVQLAAIGAYSDKSTANLTSSATWTTTDAAKATVSAGGLVTSLATGTADIIAASGSISKAATLTIVDGPVIAEPYNKAAQSSTVDWTPAIGMTDVFFLMDTTGSMDGEIANLKSSMTTIFSALGSALPDVAFGVGEYRDFPYSPYGVAGDQPFILRHRVMTALTAAGRSSITNGVNQFSAAGGNDLPESGWEAIHQLAVGSGTSAGNAAVPAFNPATAYPSTPPVGESIGTLGGAGFRQGALPVVVWVTDATNHNSGSSDLYSGFVAATRDGALAEARSLGMRIVGVISDPTASTDMLAAINGTNAVVSPAAWGTVGQDRPAGCAADQCCTGIDATGVAANGGQCPLVFSINADGTGLGTALVEGVKALTSFGSFDVSATVEDDPSDSVDVAAVFVERIVPNVSAGGCASFTIADKNSDSYNDTFLNVTPGSTLCFDIVTKTNTTISPAADAQTFKGTLVFWGDSVSELARKDVYFVVPAAPDN